MNSSSWSSTRDCLESGLVWTTPTCELSGRCLEFKTAARPDYRRFYLHHLLALFRYKRYLNDAERWKKEKENDFEEGEKHLFLLRRGGSNPSPGPLVPPKASQKHWFARWETPLPKTWTPLSGMRRGLVVGFPDPLSVKKQMKHGWESQMGLGRRRGVDRLRG